MRGRRHLGQYADRILRGAVPKRARMATRSSDGALMRTRCSGVSASRRIVEVVHVVVVDVNLLRQPGQHPNSAGHDFEFLDLHFVDRKFVNLFHLSLHLFGRDHSHPDEGG